MKKLGIAFLGVLIYLLISSSAQAVTIVAGGNSAEDTRALYAGSVLVETQGLDKYYWYVDIDSQERYPLKDGLSVSRLLKKIGQSVDDATLAKIPTKTESVGADYDIVNQYRGKILLATESNGEAWYVNPLDSRRYYIGSGNKGLQIFKNLSLDISQKKLRAISEIKDPRFRALETSDIDFGRYWHIWDLLEKNYYQPDKFDEQTLFYGSVAGLANALNDPYTEFFTPQGRKQFEQTLEGDSVEGIGAVVEVINGWLTIISPLNGLPAAKAGLQPGDQITKANDQPLHNLALNEATSFIKGPAGTPVVLTIFRPSINQTFEVTITRQKIDIPNIVGEKLDNNIAYFKVNIFSIDLNTKFRNIKNDVIDQFTKGVIIDLRNNPGGYTIAAINFLDNFLPAEQIVLREKYPTKTQIYKSNTNEAVNLPIVVLVNEGTASASEITTAALAENNGAVIVGHQTFGKGTGQDIANFSDGSALKYTVFEWLTPDGNSIEGQGITPDYIIDNTIGNDLQLKKAKELLSLPH